MRHKHYNRHKHNLECSYTSCNNTGHLKKCRYCNKLFCSEHLNAYKPASYHSPDYNRDNRGHSCPSYVDYLEQKKTEQNERYKDNLKTIIDTPSDDYKPLDTHNTPQRTRDRDREPTHHTRKTNFKDIYYRYIKPNMKFIPIICLIILGIIYFSSADNNVSLNNNQNIQGALDSVTNTFILHSWQIIAVELLALITLYTGYKYWLVKIAAIRRRYKLLRVLFVILFVLLVSYHINSKSEIGKYFSYAIFFVLVFFILKGFWLLLKWLDSINLYSDLYLWLLRIVGGILVLFGWLFIASALMQSAMSQTHTVFNNLGWIIGICIILLGAFCEFRSFRRYPMIKVW